MKIYCKECGKELEENDIICYDDFCENCYNMLVNNAKDEEENKDTNKIVYLANALDEPFEF